MTAPALSASLVPVPDDGLAARHRATALLARELCALVAPDRPPPDPSWRPGPRPDTLEASVGVVVRDHAGGHGSLARLAGALEGWRCRVVPGRVALLEARRDGGVVEASYVEEERVLVLRVSSAPVTVTRAQSLRLRAGRTRVTS